MPIYLLQSANPDLDLRTSPKFYRGRFAMSYDPNAIQPPRGWLDPNPQMISPPIGSRVNEGASPIPQPPIGSHPVNWLAAQAIAPPIGSAPTNYMGQSIQPPIGAAVNMIPSAPRAGGPDPTASTFNEARFYAENAMIPPPIGSSPANQLSGPSIPPATTWIMSPPDRR
jgi:hypothetical protein